MLRKIFLGLFASAIILVIVYMLGPKVEKEELTINFPEVPTRLSELSSYVQNREDTVIGLKPGNEAYIQWADSSNKAKTPYSIVYIHGFGASPMEGDPVHRFLAEHFGANLFVTRLPEHGIKRENGMEYLSAQKLVDAVGEAYQIGKSLGDSVIVVGTSMGGALTLLLASQQPDIKAVVVYSPAVRDNGEKLSALFNPWMKILMGKFYMKNNMLHEERTGEKKAYWSEDYHINAHVSLATLVYGNMNAKTFSKIQQPLYLGYYFKNEKEQDFVVSVPKMLEMYEQVSTPEKLKHKQAFPNTGDHVIASSITSNDWQTVLFSTIDFLENVAKVPARPEFQEQVEGMTNAKELAEGVL
ncbi:alpha/beta fold hydrolase [Algoriphagus aestuariicola]|jgi:esterase/lipase|uniref:Alpha/beta fold hydrolase n=1 Tax=Algoriphagus aestuariicola TaxID=1852016 RepID=A0ABS3BMM0_9BACT|nr:alpha/beta fold hydrolase [Algoriphagus aestuariicola]MBN7800562.1 alpha/beta fold hydrolase [Algoriphagus aestuariicola]